MAGVKIVFDQAALADLLSSEDGPVGKFIIKMTLKVRSQAQVLCPVDTGRLRSSLTAMTKREGSRIVGYVGTDVEYASYQEFGTMYMDAQPYLRPALDMVLQREGGA